MYICKYAQTGVHGKYAHTHKCTFTQLEMVCERKIRKRYKHSSEWVVRPYYVTAGFMTSSWFIINEGFITFSGQGREIDQEENKEKRSGNLKFPKKWECISKVPCTRF